MKAEIQLEKFKQAVSITERVAGKHQTLPVLSCVLVESKKNAICLRATNLDVGIEIDIPAKSEKDGVFAVPARTISSFLAQTDDNDQIARLDSTSGNLTITINRSKGIIKTLPHDDFPAIPTVSDGNETKISPELLSKGLKSVWYSAAVSNIKPELSSIYMYKDNEQAVFAATDSFRLAEKRINLKKGSSVEDMLIPFRNATEIVRVVEGSSQEEITIKSNKNLVSIDTDSIKITSRIIDGVFPDYKQIVPKGFMTEAIILKQDLATAMKTSSVFSDSFNQVHFSIDPKKKMFKIETKNSDVGQNDSELDAALSGEPIEVNFNHKYISDCIQSLDADSVSLQFNGKNKPLVIRPVSGERSFFALVMPMNR